MATIYESILSGISRDFTDELSLKPGETDPSPNTFITQSLSNEIKNENDNTDDLTSSLLGLVLSLNDS